jgi:hypothetical protein
MTFSVSHWSGRLGNNIQQIANCIMAAEKYKSTFRQKLDHDIISKYQVPFEDMTGVSQWSGEGRYYSWEALVHCEKGIYEGGNETGLGVEYIYRNMQRICQVHIAPYLILPHVEPIGSDTIVMHLRSGDNYHRIFDPPTNYIPNPLVFYLELIDAYDKCILITEPDKENPIVHELEKIDKVQIQSSTVADDFATLMIAENVALSGVGTFAMAAALCSTTIKNLYTTDLLLTEHLNYTMLYNTNVEVNVMELDNYLPVFPCSWKNTEEQRKFILEYR